MRELSLFTGAGGGLLGTKLLGRRHVGYVEWNDHCQKVLAARIRDGFLDEAPIYGDVRAFVSDGYAEAYQGMVDILNAGFPCQFVSVAGMQLVELDPRNMWPPTRDAIRIIRPRKVELENVPGLVTTGYIRRVIADLAAMGYVGLHGCLSAGATGADHKRERVWIAAYADGERQPGSRPRWESFDPTPDAYREAGGLVDAVQRADLPFVCGSHDGFSDWMDRVAALGNAQVPSVVANAWRVLA
jgi:DNA (cytosine-5)-methyltransferase 1